MNGETRGKHNGGRQGHGLAVSLPAFLAVVALMGGVVTSGCTPEARQDVGKAGTNLDQAVDKSAQGTAAAFEKARIPQKTDQAVDKLSKETDKIGSDFKKGAEEAGTTTQEGAAPVVLTPRVRAAIGNDPKVTIKDLNVDTRADTKQVVVTGVAPSALEKSEAIADARKSLADSASSYTVVDHISVGKAK